MNLDVDTFLNEYWQKKPLLIRQAFPGFPDLLAPEELAGLACEPLCDARLVREKGGDYPWQVTYGPFSEEEISTLPASHWSILVRHVDKLVPPIADLKDQFYFLPDWRKEDIMVSFAPQGGTVGAHTDNYDVFLIQGQGSRQWDIGFTPLMHEELEPLSDIRILKNFVPDASYVLLPGDMLYLPPRFAHAGKSIQDSLTFSMGFRAPSPQELLAGYWNNLAEAESQPIIIKDPVVTSKTHPAALDDVTLKQFHSQIKELVIDEELFTQWLSRKLSEPDHDIMPEANPERSEADVIALLKDGHEIRRNEAIRYLYRKRSADICCYTGGIEHIWPISVAPVIELIGDSHAVKSGDIDSHLNDQDISRFLYLLYNESVIYFVSDMDW